MSEKPKRWRHARKGLITGHVVGATSTHTQIKLVGDHKPKMQSEANQGIIWRDGHVITVRTILLDEL